MVFWRNRWSRRFEFANVGCNLFFHASIDVKSEADLWHGFHEHYFNRTWPAEYLTNCEGAHPTIKGYKVIADELAAFVKYKGYA